MFEGFVEGLRYLTVTTLLWMSFGVVVATLIAVIPGLGGTFAIVVLLPFAFSLPTESGLALLMGGLAVIGTGNTITSVLFGVPGSPTAVATTFDGYPMAKKGEGTRAVAAGLTASAVGGIIGAIALVLMLPIMRPLVLSLGSPEFFVLILAALAFMGFVGSKSMTRSLTAGFLGLMLSFVGMEISTGTTRYTFGQLFLWEGIHLVPLMIGLFAIAEVVVLLRRGGSIAVTPPTEAPGVQVRRGMFDVVRHWRTTLQSSITGVLIGAAPGLGGSTAQFIAYTQALKTSPNGADFGTGTVEGVIAADAAVNSTDGGSLVPSLAFGIPGSAPMAIILAAMISMGVQPGQEMLTDNIGLLWLFIFVLVLGNVLGAAICLSVSGVLAKVTRVRGSALAGPVLIVSVFGAYATSGHYGDVLVALLFGAVGYVMIRFDYSRATFVIGFVLGILLERHYLLSMRLYGWGFLDRPGVRVITVLTVLVIAFPAIKRLALRRRGAAEPPIVAGDDQATTSSDDGDTKSTSQMGER